MVTEIVYDKILGKLREGSTAATVSNSNVDYLGLNIQAENWTSPTINGAVYSVTENNVPIYSFDYVSNNTIIVRIYNDGGITTNKFSLALRLQYNSSETDESLNTSYWKAAAKIISTPGISNGSLGNYSYASVQSTNNTDEVELTIQNITANGDITSNGVIEIHLTRDVEEATIDTYTDYIGFINAKVQLNIPVINNRITIPANAFNTPTENGAVYRVVNDIPVYQFEEVDPTFIVCRVYPNSLITTKFDATLRLKSNSDAETDNTSVWSVFAKVVNIEDGIGVVGDAQSNTISISESDNEEVLTITDIIAGGIISDGACLEIYVSRSSDADPLDDYSDLINFISLTLEINK